MIQLLDQESFLKTIKGLIKRAILNTVLMKKISQADATVEIVNIINDYLDELINGTKDEKINTDKLLLENLSYISTIVDTNDKISDINKKLFKQNINSIITELKKKD